MSDKTYSEVEVEALVQAKVAEATASLQAELDTIKSSEEAQAVQARIDEARAEADEKVKDLQAQLDAAEIRAQEATTAREELEAFLQSESERVEREAALASLREERKTRVAEAAHMSEEYIEANADRWAGMSDEDFEAALADYKAVAEKASASTGSGSGVPAGTALHASRDDAPSGKRFAATHEVMRLRDSGVDLREITR